MKAVTNGFDYVKDELLQACEIGFKLTTLERLISDTNPWLYIPVKVGHQLEHGVEMLVRPALDTRQDTVSSQHVIDEHRGPANRK